jgi:hypothetical protein
MVRLRTYSLGSVHHSSQTKYTQILALQKMGYTYLYAEEMERALQYVFSSS